MHFVIELLIEFVGEFVIEAIVECFRRKPKLTDRPGPPRLESRIPGRRFNSSRRFTNSHPS
jgi:hypothetical protein